MTMQADTSSRATRRYALRLGIGALVMIAGYVLADTLDNTAFAVPGALLVIAVIAGDSRNRAHRSRDQSALGLVLLTIALRAVFGFIPEELLALRLATDVLIVLPLFVYAVRLWLRARPADDAAPETEVSGA